LKCSRHESSNLQTISSPSSKKLRRCSLNETISFWITIVYHHGDQANIGHRATLKKIQDKKEKTLKDEKALYAAENALEAATQDYNYFNDMLKEELPTLFALEAEFIRPLFQNFYYMQLNIFYTLNEKMSAMQIDYFDFTVDIEEQYEAKRGDVKEQAEALSIVHFKGTGRKRTPDYKPDNSIYIRWEIQIRN
jgi:hypothetical protein